MSKQEYKDKDYFSYLNENALRFIFGADEDDINDTRPKFQRDLIQYFNKEIDRTISFEKSKIKYENYKPSNNYYVKKMHRNIIIKGFFKKHKNLITTSLYFTSFILLFLYQKRIINNSNLSR